MNLSGLLRRLGLAAGIVVAAAWIGALGLNIVLERAIHSRKPVMVPDLTGKTLLEAMGELDLLNLNLRPGGEQFDPKSPAGTILSQSPAPGAMVRAGKVVRAVLSQGGRVVYVPDVAGQPVRRAELMLRQSGLALGEESQVYSLRQEKEKIVSQDPAPRTVTERDTLVNLVVSAGPPPGGMELMPAFSGETIQKAQDWARQHGFTLRLTTAAVRELSAPAAPGTIVSQAPAPDAILDPGTTVSVAVAPEAAPGAGAGPPEIPNGTVFYQVAQGSADRMVRIVLQDGNGRREIFRQPQAPGSKITLPVRTKGGARVLIYVNDVLTEDRPL